MSGIAGIIKEKNQNPEKEKVEIMLDKISHRGANQVQIMDIDGSSLGIRSNSPNGSGYGLLLDGKIFNIDELSQKYSINMPEQAEDSKKISILVKHRGSNIIKELRGAFSLILWDENNQFYLARDIIGVKPLYYIKDSQRLIFASEIKSLIPFCGKVKEFPPGHIMKNMGDPVKYEGIETKADYIDDTETDEMISLLEEKLNCAVGKRITDSKKRIGVWLSGGVDSSLVAALVKNFTDQLYTFSVGFEGSPDLLSSKVVAEALGTRHIEHRLSLDELYETIPEVIYHLESFDAPLVRSSLGNMIASRISSKADIVFSGEGGDEVFAGYNYFLDFDSEQVIQKELIKAINSLHNTALQRVDRLANANHVIVRLPMLDENLINFALTIPTEEKIKKQNNISKYILRKVAEKYLPHEIAWRGKEKFWEGSGILDTLTKKIEYNIGDHEFENNRKLDNGFILRNKEEMYFYNIFRDFFGDLDIGSILSFTLDFN